jgi:SAM-dependent methyltransferase
MTATATSDYAFPTGDKAAEQLDALETVLDPLTTARLTELNIPPGARCWEAGAGGGSIARWLANRVRPSGRVVATDTDISRLHPAGNLDVDEHDLRDDHVPPGGPFDVVHARLVLLHLPQRREILHRLIAATTPGGWLLIEEFDCTVPLRVLHAPGAGDAELFGRYVDTLLVVLHSRGADLDWAQQIHPLMAQAGLRHVHTMTHAESWTGGSPGCRLHHANSVQMERPLVELGLTADNLHRLRALMADAGFEVMSYQLVSTRGQVSKA